MLLGEPLHEQLHLLVVLREVRVLKAFQLDHELLEGGDHGPLFLRRLGLLPITDAAAHSLHALQEREVMTVPAETAAQGALVAGMVAMAIPADFLPEGALLVLVVCGIAVQAEQPLQVGVAHLRPRETQRSVALARLRVGHDLLGLRLRLIVRARRGRGRAVTQVAHVAAEHGCAHAHAGSHPARGPLLRHAERRGHEERVRTQVVQDLLQHGRDGVLGLLDLLLGGRGHHHGGARASGAAAAGHARAAGLRLVAAVGLNYDDRLQGQVLAPLQGENAQPELVRQLPPDPR
mmetsp:Transcript_62140/g.172227  ORF Transcript_62140/g.172227 Transcript_62140/m.172227 type:complete len:291 (-) Transcript_62140:328-1200(-)